MQKQIGGIGICASVHNEARNSLLVRLELRNQTLEPETVF